MYPSALPSYDPFTTPITLAAMHHSDRHRDMEADILALATKVGIDSSADTSSLDYKIATMQTTLSTLGVDLTNLTATVSALSTTVSGISTGATTLLAPTISSFTNATHNHQNSTGGGQLTSASVKPTYRYIEGDNGTPSTRQSVSGTSYVTVSGTNFSYTSGPTPEILFIDGRFLMTATAGGSMGFVGVNGSPAGRGHYSDTVLNNSYQSYSPMGAYEIAANTTVTIQLLAKLVSGTGTIANTQNDVTAGYSPSIRLLAFAR